MLALDLFEKKFNDGLPSSWETDERNICTQIYFSWTYLVLLYFFFISFDIGCVGRILDR